MTNKPLDKYRKELDVGDFVQFQPHHGSSSRANTFGTVTEIVQEKLVSVRWTDRGFGIALTAANFVLIKKAYKMNQNHKEMLVAIARGEEIEYFDKEDKEWYYTEPNSVLIDISNEVNVEFRVKPKIIMIGDVAVPVPERVAPKASESYYLPDPAKINDGDNMYKESKWPQFASVGSWANKNLDSGLIHLTKENAIIHAQALLKLTQKN